MSKRNGIRQQALPTYIYSLSIRHKVQLNKLKSHNDSSMVNIWFVLTNFPRWACVGYRIKPLPCDKCWLTFNVELGSTGGLAHCVEGHTVVVTRILGLDLVDEERVVVVLLNELPARRLFQWLTILYNHKNDHTEYTTVAKITTHP